MRYTKFLEFIENNDFKPDAKLISELLIKGHHINIKWFHSKYHPIVQRIKNRTNFISISSFNTFIEKLLNNFFDNHLNEVIKNNEPIRYALVIPNHNFTLILEINYEKIFENISIVTIINHTPTSENVIIMNEI